MKKSLSFIKWFIWVIIKTYSNNDCLITYGNHTIEVEANGAQQLCLIIGITGLALAAGYGIYKIYSYFSNNRPSDSSIEDSELLEVEQNILENTRELVENITNGQIDRLKQQLLESQAKAVAQVKNEIMKDNLEHLQTMREWLLIVDKKQSDNLENLRETINVELDEFADILKNSLIDVQSKTENVDYKIEISQTIMQNKINMEIAKINNIIDRHINENAEMVQKKLNEIQAIVEGSDLNNNISEVEINVINNQQNTEEISINIGPEENIGDISILTDPSNVEAVTNILTSIFN
jgi:hypothetical protein